MPLAATPDGSDGSGATTPSPSPSAVAGDEEEASNGQGRTGDDGGVQAIGVRKSVTYKHGVISHPGDSISHLPGTTFRADFLQNHGGGGGGGRRTKRKIRK